MSDKRRDVQAAELDKVQVHQDFLEKFSIRAQMKDALLKLIENRPENPMLFLSNYFEALAAENKADRVAHAVQTLRLSHHSSPAFFNNLVLAYEILSAPRNPASKKLANKRAGMSGSVHEELLNFICTEVPKELVDLLLEKVCCRRNEMVPFEVFKYSVTVAYVLKDFVTLSEDLYHVLSGKNENEAARYLCDAAVSSFREALDRSGSTDIPAAIEVGRRLRPDSLAYAMLQAKEDEGDAYEVMEMAVFVHMMANVYLDNVKCIK